MNVEIAVGRSRTDMHWTNVSMTWAELMERLKPKRCNHTRAEYEQMSKDAQTKAKDIGGYIGGVLKEEGSRKDDNLLCRTLLTLDIDKATELPKEPRSQKAMVIHSTHSHTVERPSYRIIAPLSRRCTALEYQAVAHKVAELSRIIEIVDPASFKPSQMMFWGSAPSDGDIIYIAQEGEPIDVDYILGLYNDYSDPAEWATAECPRPKKGSRNRLNEKKYKTLSGRVGDPLEKKNIVGAWCRNHSIYDVMEMLSGLYVYAGRDRYTYSGGSTVGGAVVYGDGRFVYSYHSTDPLGGQLLNSFDLYRLAVYGALDAEAAKTTRTDRLPSYNAMCEYAMKDDAVKLDFMKCANEEVGFNIVGDATEEGADDGWQAELEVNKRGLVESTLSNICIILRNDVGCIKGRVCFEVFRQQIVVYGELPWERTEGKLWTDSDGVQLAVYIEQKYGIKGIGNVNMALEAVVREDQYRRHFVKEYIERAEWDGVPRVATLFIDYLGVPNSEFFRAVSRKAIVACVARIYEPGVKYDQIVVFSGDENMGKSTLLKRLAGEYFMDSFTLDNGNKSMQESLVGSWIIEIPELQGFHRAEMTTVKAFVSKQQDRFRPAYGRYTIEVPRTCAFFATTNENDFLKDSTGNRRFWILPCSSISKYFAPDITDETVAQVWAEAKVIYDEGKEKLYLDKEQMEELKEVQRDFDGDLAQLGALSAFLDVLLPSDWNNYSKQERREFFMAWNNGKTYFRGDFGVPCNPKVRRDEVSAMEVLNEYFMMDSSSYNVKMANALLRKLEGWKFGDYRKRLGGGYGMQRMYKRKLIDFM